MIDKQADKDWEWRRCGGGEVGVSVAWLGASVSGDGPHGDENVAITRGRAVQIFRYRQALGKLEKIATLDGHEGVVTFVSAVPSQKRCITGARDGSWRLWDSTDGALLKVWDAGTEVEKGAMCALEDFSPDGASSAWGCVANKSQAEVLARDLQTGKVEIVMPSPGRTSSGILVAAVGRAVAVSASRQLSVTEWRGKSNIVLSLEHVRPITALAMHPFDGSIAVGDEAGVITIYRALAPRKDQDTSWPRRWKGHVDEQSDKDSTRKRKIRLERGNIPHSTHHWHAHGVTSLAFTSDGNTLLSGGFESVLVAWQLMSGSRKFLPRIGAATPIVCISSNASGTVLTLTTGDNAVRFVSTLSWSIETQLRGVKPPNPQQGSLKVVSESTSSGYVLLCGQPSSLQIFDVFRDQHVTDLPVCASNATSKGSRNTPILPRVELAAISDQSQVLATVDHIELKSAQLSSPASVFSSENLRFWERDDKLGIFVVHTVVNDAHRGGRITKILFHPGGRLLVTVSNTGMLRVWRKPLERSDKAHWMCVSCESYRGMPFNDCSISPDGSLIGVASGAVLVLWTLDSNSGELAFVQALSHAPSTETITHVGFPGSESTLVVAATTKSLYVWNTISMVVWWSCSLDILEMSHDPLHDRFAVAIRLPPPDSVERTTKRRRKSTDSFSSCVVLFGTNSPVPLACHRLPGASKVHSLSFLTFLDDKGCKDSGLVWLDDALEFNTLVPPDTNPPLVWAEGSDHSDVESTSLLTTNNVVRRGPAPQWRGIRETGLQQLREILKIDTHILPGSQSLLQSLCGSLVKDRVGESQNANIEDEPSKMNGTGDSPPEVPSPLEEQSRSLDKRPFRRAERWGQFEKNGDSVLEFVAFFEGLLGQRVSFAETDVGRVDIEPGDAQPAQETQRMETAMEIDNPNDEPPTPSNMKTPEKSIRRSRRLSMATENPFSTSTVKNGAPDGQDCSDAGLSRLRRSSRKAK